MSRNIANWVDGFLYYTENTEPRESYRRWVAISTIASVLQRKCWLDWGTEVFYPNMYVVLVGPPAARKGTAMRPGKKFLDKLGIPIAADESSRPKLIQTLKEVSALVSNPDGVSTYHSSLTIFASELTVFLGYEDRDLLSMFCKLYDCEDRYVYDTIGRGREEVPNVWVNLIGATTPGQLQAAVPEGFVGSGFTSRVVFIYEDDKEKVVIKPGLTKEQTSIEELLRRDLEDIHKVTGPFSVTPEFENMYSNWRYKAEATKPFTDARLEYYAQRRPTHLFKLSMIFCAARTDERLITVEDLAEAITSLESVEQSMPRVFAGIGSNPLAGIQSRLRIVISEREEMPMSEVATMFANDVTFTQLSEAIASLEQMGVCSVDPLNRRLVFKKPKKGPS